MRKIGLFLGSFVLLLILILGGTLLYLTTPNGQAKVSKLLFDQASHYLKTPIEGRLSYQFPDWVVAEDFLVKDQQGDTLIYTKRLKVDIDMWALIRRNKVIIHQVELKNTLGYIHRRSNATTFNFEFLTDIFSSPSTDTSQKELEITWKNVVIEQMSLVIKDDLLGNHVRARLEQLTTGFSTFDLSNSQFDVLPTTIRGVQLDGTIHNWGSKTDNATASTPSVLQLAMKPIHIHRFDWNVNNHADTLYTRGQLESFSITPKQVNLATSVFDFHDIRLRLDNIAFATNPTYSNTSDFPFAALKGEQVRLDLPRISYSPQKSYLHVRGLSMKEVAQVRLKQFSTELTITPQKWEINSLIAQTSQSELRLAGRISTLKSELLKTPVSAWQIWLNAQPSQVDISEIGLFYPDIHRLTPVREGKLRFYSELMGSLNDLSIRKSHIQAPKGILVDLKGQFKGLSDLAKAQGNVDFRQINLSKGWHAWLPDSLTSSYHIPESIHLKGGLTGSMSSLKGQLNGVAKEGNITLSGNWKAKTISSPESISLMGSIEDLALGVLLRDTSIQTLTSTFTVIARSPFDTPKRAVRYAIEVDKIGYQGLIYKDIHSDGLWEGSNLNFNIRTQTEQISAQFGGTFNWSEDFYLHGDGYISHFPLSVLDNQLPAPITLRKTPLKIDLTVSNLTKISLNGFLDIPQSTWQTESREVNLEKVAIQFTHAERLDKIHITSPFMDASITGNESFSVIPSVLEHITNEYFQLPESPLATIKDTLGHWTVQGTLAKHPIIDLFITQKIDFQPVVFAGQLHADKSRPTSFTFNTPVFKMDSLEVQELSFKLHTTEPSAVIQASIAQLRQGDFRIKKANSYVTFQQNKADARLIVLDSLDRKIHQVGFLIESEKEAVRVALAPQSVLIYYTPWESLEMGYAKLHPSHITFHQLGIHAQNQELSITSDAQHMQDWLIHAKNLDLKTLSTAITRDDNLLAGRLTADVTVRDVSTSPTFTGDIGINQLNIIGTSIGDFEAVASNQGTEHISVEASLKGPSNDITLRGKYALNDDNPLDLMLQVKRLDAATLQAFSLDQLRDTRGNLVGRFQITGQTEHPTIAGELRFNQFRTTINQTGTPISIDKQTITATNQQLILRDFIIKDSLDNKLELDGKINYANLSQINYQINLRTTDFLASNARRSDNELFYGTAFLDAQLAISGENEHYLMTGNLRVADKTKLTVLMPADEQIGSEMDQLITFISHKKEIESIPKKINITKKNVPSSTFNNTGVTVNVQVSDQAELTIIMDELTGDNIKVRGRGQLTTGLDQNGELFVLGKYTILEGTYRLTYQIFERTFYIDESSKSSIVWKGDPTDADISIRASYKVNKPLAGYPLSSKNASDETRLQANIPFSVDIVLGGELLAPQTEFALTIQKEIAERQLGTDLTNRLAEEGFTLFEPDKITQQAKSPRAEANKETIKEQAIFMLMFGRFNLFGTSLSQPIDAEGFARKQVSQLVSEQLDKLADDILKGIDLDLGVQSESSVDHRLRSTNVNVGVKKGFFNNRVSVSVGKNFELESAQRQSQEVFDNITANYSISKDGRYRFKAFRTNQYQIEGFVVETGVGFVLTLDYDATKEIFKRQRVIP